MKCQSKWRLLLPLQLLLLSPPSVDLFLFAFVFLFSVDSSNFVSFCSVAQQLTCPPPSPAATTCSRSSFGRMQIEVESRIRWNLHLNRLRHRQLVISIASIRCSHLCCRVTDSIELQRVKSCHCCCINSLQDTLCACGYPLSLRRLAFVSYLHGLLLLWKSYELSL